VTGQVWWYAARSAGVVAWMLLSLAVLGGLALSTRAFGRRPRPNWLLDLHRFIGGLAVVFTAVHVLAILIESYVHISILNVLFPFTGSWHPVAVAWGIVAMYALVAVEVTSLLRARLSPRAWRATHYLSFPLFVSATIHMLSAGTDRHAPLLRGAFVLVVAGFAALVAIRISRLDPPASAPAPARVPDAARRALVGAGTGPQTGGDR